MFCGNFLPSEYSSWTQPFLLFEIPHLLFFFPSLLLLLHWVFNALCCVKFKDRGNVFCLLMQVEISEKGGSFQILVPLFSDLTSFRDNLILFNCLTLILSNKILTKYTVARMCKVIIYSPSLSCSFSRAAGSVMTSGRTAWSSNTFCFLKYSTWDIVLNDTQTWRFRRIFVKHVKRQELEVGHLDLTETCCTDEHDKN